MKLLVQRSDASWKDDAIKKLSEDEWVSSNVIDYLAALDLPETKTALDTFAKQIRNQAGDPKTKKSGRHDGKLSTLRGIDDARVKAQLRALPIR